MDDLISRSDAIGAVKEERFPIDSDYAEGFMAALDKVEWILKEWLPSAQPETHEERTETHACDLISRQWLMECVNEGWIKFDTKKDENRFIHLVRDIAPSAQPDSKELSPTHKALDTISRQAAVDRISKQREHLQPEIYPQDKIGDAAYRICAEFIERLPSEQADLDEVYAHAETEAEARYHAQQRWIPCSERLPEDGTDCLVSVRCSKKVVVVDMATYSTDLFAVDKEDFFGNCGESGWYYLDREYGYCKVLNVIAWMPLPEPYRAERRTDGIR